MLHFEQTYVFYVRSTKKLVWKFLIIYRKKLSLEYIFRSVAIPL